MYPYNQFLIYPPNYLFYINFYLCDYRNKIIAVVMFLSVDKKMDKTNSFIPQSHYIYYLDLSVLQMMPVKIQVMM